jgi:hypothetical protein
VLGVGIDWAEEFHVVALGRPSEGVIEVLRVEHRPRAVAALVERIAGLEADPAEVRVVLETRHGLLVEALVEAGYTVLPVNPELVSRRRGPARKKDDAEDARICCLIALDRHAGLRRLIPHGELAGELRSIARDDERACRDERRLLNRLRADLLVTFPAALAIAGEDLGATRILRLLERWPTAQALAAASREEIIEFGRAQRTGYLRRFADRIQAALAEDQFTAPEHLVRAKVDTIRLTARQLLLIDAQRRAWEKRMGELLLGPHAGQQDAEDQPGQAFPGGEIYLSFPGLGRRLAARIAGEVGEHIEQFTTPNSLQCYAGRASPAAPASVTWWSPTGSPATVTWPTRCTSGRSPASAALNGPGTSTTPSAPAARTTTPRCEPSATAGSRCSGTASPTTCPTTRPSTPPTATGPSPRSPRLRPDPHSQATSDFKIMMPEG